MGAAFDYAEAFSDLDYEALKQELAGLVMDSQECGRQTMATWTKVMNLDRFDIY